MPYTVDRVLRGSPGVREQGGGRLPDEAEDVGVTFDSAARGPEVFWGRSGMGVVRKAGSGQGKWRAGEGLRLHGGTSKLHGVFCPVTAPVLHFSIVQRVRFPGGWWLGSRDTVQGLAQFLARSWPPWLSKWMTDTLHF